MTCTRPSGATRGYKHGTSFNINSEGSQNMLIDVLQIWKGNEEDVDVVFREGLGGEAGKFKRDVTYFQFNSYQSSCITPNGHLSPPSVLLVDKRRGMKLHTGNLLEVVEDRTRTSC